MDHLNLGIWEKFLWRGALSFTFSLAIWMRVHATSDPSTFWVEEHSQIWNIQGEGLLWRLDALSPLDNCKMKCSGALDVTIQMFYSTGTHTWFIYNYILYIISIHSFSANTLPWLKVILAGISRPESKETLSQASSGKGVASHLIFHHLHHFAFSFWRMYYPSTVSIPMYSIYSIYSNHSDLSNPFESTPSTLSNLS